MSTRILGAVLFVTSLIVMLNGFRTASAGYDSPIFDPLGSVVYVLWGIGGICGIVGMLQLNALGTKAAARAAGFLPILGFACFIVGDGLRVLGFLDVEDPIYDLLASVAWIGVLAGMLIVGILTIAAGVWRGWRRFVPLLAVLMLPVALIVGGMTGSTNITSVIGWSSWLLLAYVIAAAEPLATPQQSSAL